MKPYTKLSEFYSENWGNFCLNYLKIMNFIREIYHYTPNSILDISCGTGELVRELYKLKYQVVGSDISENMISIARKISSKNINFFVGDMAHIKFNRKFDIIISAFDSINYIIEIEHLHKMFTNIDKHLNDDGYFIFDINTPSMYLEKHHGAIEDQYNGIRVAKIFSYDSINKLAKTTFEFSNKYSEIHIQKAYSKGDIIRVIEGMNFKICRTLKNFNFDCANKKSHRIIFILKSTRA